MDNETRNCSVDKFKELLDTLTDIERTCLIHRYGLYGQTNKTYRQIGEMFAIPRERVREIVGNALRKMRHLNRKHYWQYIPSEHLRIDIIWSEDKEV